MDCDQGSILEDAQLIGKRVDFHQPGPGRVRDAVGIAADADHALTRDTALQLQHRPERSQRQWPQMLSFFGEGLVDHAQGRSMHPRIGDGIQPMPELGIEIIEIAEGARQEEVLADVAERPLDLALCLGTIRLARSGVKAIVTGEIDERAIKRCPQSGLRR